MYELKDSNQYLQGCKYKEKIKISKILIKNSNFQGLVTSNMSFEIQWRNQMTCRFPLLHPKSQMNECVVSNNLK